MSISCSLNLHVPKALPSPSSSPPQCRLPSLPTFIKNQKQPHNQKPIFQDLKRVCRNHIDGLIPDKTSFAISIGALLTTVAGPALAVTGMHDDEDLTTTLVDAAIAGFFYFLVAPPVIMNWLRIRWNKRGLLEMYFQFMFVFLFFPGVLLWAPFLNFRQFPRDPSMKNPWSVPEDPSLIRNSFRKYPWAGPDVRSIFDPTKI